MTTHTPAKREAAIQEGERVAAADEYFAARTWIMDTNDNRRIFEAGFDRAYALLSKLRAPVADERVSLRGAANLAFNALHECKPAKGAEKQYSDAIQALQSALHDIAYTVNRTATPQQFADHLQREARAALASAPVAGEAIAGYMVGTDYFRPDVLTAARIYAENRNLPVRTLRYADAAPQASNAAHKGAAAMARSFGAPDMADALAGRASEAVRDAEAGRDTGKDRLSFHIWALVHGMDITPNDSCGYVSPLTQRAWMRWNPPEPRRPVRATGRAEGEER